MAGRTVEATDRLTKVVILETSKVVINTVSTSNSQTGSLLKKPAKEQLGR